MSKLGIVQNHNFIRVKGRGLRSWGCLDCNKILTNLETRSHPRKRCDECKKIFDNFNSRKRYYERKYNRT